MTRSIIPQRLDLMAARRAQLRVPQWKVARVLKCSQARISLIECGLTEPSQDEKRRIGELLGVRPELLFGGDCE